jgi:hypothetical protein
MGQWNHTLTHVLSSSYQVLTNTSSGWYNRRLVRDTDESVAPRLQGYFSIPIYSIYVELERHIKNIYICGTQFSNR